jgi:hypothetical protein
MEKPTQTTMQFYVWSNLILQLSEFEKALPMFTTKPAIQKRRAAFRTELNRLHNLLRTSFTNAELELMHEAAAGFGQAVACSILNPTRTTETLDKLYQEIQNS